jgi:hypothetical protein
MNCKTLFIFKNRNPNIKIHALLMLFFLFHTSHAQIQFRSSSYTTATTATITIDKPTGLQIGDLMIAIHNQSRLTSSQTPLPFVAPPSGWTTRFNSQYINSLFKGSINFKIATASDVNASSFTFTRAANTGNIQGAIIAFSGVNSTTPFNVVIPTSSTVVSNSGATSAIASSITTTIPNAAVIMVSFLTDDRNFNSWSTPQIGSLTEIVDGAFDATNDMGMGVAWGIMANAGITGNGSAALSAGSSSNSRLFALNPCSLTTSPGTLSGTQTVCQGDTTIFTSSVADGEWLSSNTSVATVDASTGVITGISAGNSTILYTKIGSEGSCPGVATRVITVSPAGIGGTVSGGTTICQGSTSGLLTLSGHTGTVIRWEKSVSPFSSWATIDNTTFTHTSVALNETTQFRAVVQSGDCSTKNSSATTVTIDTPTIWNGTTWNNGTPTSTKAAIIESDYTSVANLEACSIVVTNNANVVISSGDNVTLSGALTVNSGSSFTLENEATLIQNGASNNNTGNIKVKRNTQDVMRLDYTLWSSPVEAQNLGDFSPLTVANRFYTYTTATNVYATTANTNHFTVGQGYLIRSPNNHPTTPTAWEGIFIGKPNSGDINFGLSTAGTGFNAVGNPYPSPISIATFLADNSSVIAGNLYFWRKTNGATGSAYVTFNGATFSSGPQTNNVIQPGQGFIVEANAAGNLLFNNQQRVADNGTFFRNANSNQSENNSRIWLNLLTNNTVVGQMAVGYRDDATNGLDTFDAPYINDNMLALNSFVATTELAVQHRAAFEANDTVPLSFKTNSAGTYSITINAVDGLFDNASQSIFLKDNLLNTEHDLRNSPYTFVSETGQFTNRFEIVYQSTLSLANPTVVNDVVVYTQNNTIEIITVTDQIAAVNVYDLKGSLLTTVSTATTSSVSLPLVNVAKQVLIVQVTMQNGATVTKKVVR